MRTATIAVALAATALLVGCEFDIDADTCQNSQNCEWGCGEGLCNWECVDQSRCTADCQGGGCDLECRNQAECTFDCPGGDCTLSCYDQASGDLWCPPDVPCSIENFGNADCGRAD